MPTTQGGESDLGEERLAPDEMVSEVVAVLTELYSAYVVKSGKRKVSDNQFARWLKVSPSNWNYWINGSRLPDLRNALLLAPRIEELLDRDTRARFLQILGYPNFYEVNDPTLQSLLGRWSELPRETKEQIYELLNAGGKPGRSNR